MVEVIGRSCPTCRSPKQRGEPPTCACPKNYRTLITIRCACRRELDLHDGFLNTCDCGRDYNGSGQLLAPRSQWGEETGETLADILGPSWED